MLLQLVSGRQLVDFFGNEVVFDHLTTRKLCVFQGRFELFNLTLQSLALILWKSWVSKRGSCAWLPHTYSLFLPLILFDLSSLCLTYEDSFLEGKMEGFELYPEEFLRLFDGRRFGTGFRRVQWMGDGRIGVKPFENLFEDFLVVCDPRMDDRLCE